MPALEKKSWNDFVLAAPEHTFLHAWSWGVLQEQLGVPYWRLTVTQGEALHAVALVIKRSLPWGKSWLYMPRGPVFAPNLSDQEKTAAWQELEQQLRALAEREHALFIRLDPAWPMSRASELTMRGWAKAEREVQPQDTIILDLKPAAEELLAAMHQKTRYNIRLAQKQGVQVAFSTAPAAIETFLTLARDVQARSGFHYHPDEYYRAMHAALAPDILTIAIATHEREPLAAHILVSFGNTTAYVHGASSSRQRQLMAPHLLQWESIQRARAEGQAHYDFFGVAPAGAGASHSWGGITRFKEGFGGQRAAYVGTHDYIFDRVGYAGFTVARRLRKLWR